MADVPKIYVDACPLIDMAKHKASRPLAESAEKNAEREQDVWYMKRLLAASRDGVISVVSSFATIAECLSIRDKGEPRAIPDPNTQRFYSELLTSAKSGLLVIYPTTSIMEKVRDLWWRHEIFLKPMDAIHVATAMDRRCKEILTRDGDIYKNRERLAQLRLTVIYPSNTALLPAAYAQDDFHEKLSET